MKMRESQRTIFWKNHRVVVFTENGKISRVWGLKRPQTAQEIIEEASND